MKETIPTEKTEFREELNFHTLTPTVIDGENVETYIKALDFAIGKEDVFNIALTGSYGSGKSSVIKTFFDRNKNLPHLNISLASFNQEDFGFEGEQENYKKQKRDSVKKSNGITDSIDSFSFDENLERLLELSILQQIFYHVEHSKIPDSRFKRIKSLGKDEMRDFSFLVIIWFLSSWYLFFPKIISFSFSKRLDSDIIRLFVLGIFLTGLAKLVSHIRRIYNNSKLNKLNVQSLEVEIDKDIDHSILNKHLDEIIYFFEVNPIEIVVIEDLDRFDNPHIFSKLREINLLINSSKQVNRHIVFIYAIRDNLFGDSSRTKFFDFIIPVIPVINYSNSSGFLKKYFKNLEFGKRPSDNFIEKISSFITDMRLLNNIFNEYLIYRKSISKSLSQNNTQQEILFSLIVCKNLFPRDFMLLTKGKGELHKILSQRDYYINRVSEDLKKEMLKVSREIDLIQKERAKDAEELKSIYVQKLQESLLNSVGVYFNDDLQDFSSLQKLGMEDFERFTQTSKIKYRQLSGSPKDSSSNIRDITIEKSFKDIEREVDPQNTFKDRLEKIKDKQNLESKFGKLKRLEQNLLEIETWDISKLISKISDHSIFGSYSENALILFLIKEGYLKEEYTGYISYFYEGEFTEGDNKFYQSVLAGLQHKWTFKLVNVDKVINKIPLKYFREKPILNFYLVQTLLIDRFRYPMKSKFLINQLSDGSEYSKLFFEEFLKNGSGVAPFINILSSSWSGLWDFVSEEEKFSLNQKKDYFELILKYASLESIRKFAESSDNFERDLIEEENFFGVYRSVPTKKLKDVFKELKLELHYIDQPEDEESKLLFQFIFENKYFKYNLHNFYIFYSKFCGKKVTYEEFASQPLDLILDSKCEDLIKVYSEDTSKLVKGLYFREGDVEKTLSQSLFTELLNSKNIPTDNKLQLIKMVHGRISLGDISDANLWLPLLEEEKIIPSWRDVLLYFQTTTPDISDPLKKYLNKESVLKELASINFISTENTEVFEEKIFTCDSFDYTSYKQLTTFLFDRPWNNLNFKDLSNEKIAWLIQKRFLSFTKENYNSIKEINLDLLVVFIEKSQKEFRELINQVVVDEDIAIKLFMSGKIRKNTRIKIITSKGELLKSREEELLKLISKFIITNPAIENLELKDVKNIISSTKDLSDKINIVLKYQHLLEYDSLQEVLRIFPYKVKRILSGAKHLKLENTIANLKFSKLLEEHNIASAKPPNEEDEIRIIGKRKK